MGDLPTPDAHTNHALQKRRRSVRYPTTYHAALKEKTAPAQRHLLLTATVVLLPFSYVPHEIIRAGPNITWLVMVLILMVGIKYRVLVRGTGGVDVAAVVFAVYMAIRMLILAPLEDTDSPFNASEAFTACGTILGGIILLRVAQKPELRAPILRGLKVMIAILLAIEMYQVAAGLPRLLALGYDKGFYFHTGARGGQYRPFSTFLSPTVFGGYLAVAGAFVVAMSKGKSAFFWFVAVTGGLTLTDTRAAWFGFAAALVVVFLIQSPDARKRVMVGAVPVTLAVTVLILAAPALFAEQWERLQSVTDTGLTSNASRLILWEGTVGVIGESPLIGFGPQSFSEVLYSDIGTVALLGHAHSNYLQILFSYGLIGLGLFGVTLILALAGLRRARPNGHAVAATGAVAAFIVDSAMETTWTSFSVVTTLFLIIGMGLPTSKESTGSSA